MSAPPAADINRQRIAAVRKKRGQTQQDLAERVGISASRLAFIEAGVISCRLDVAEKLSEALDTEVRLLFPGAIKELGHGDFQSLSDAQLSRIDALGLDVDPREWYARGTLSCGQEVLWELSSRDMRRMFGALRRMDDDRFFVFDSGEKRVVLNLDHLWSCQLLYEQPIPGKVTITEEPDESEDEDEDDWIVEVTYSVPHVAPQRFSMEPDMPSREDIAQTADIFKMAETHDIDSSPFIARLTDVDGEDAFIRMDAVAMLTAPILLVEPNVELESDEDED